MENQDKRVVLCGANAYEQKYYFNEQFKGIPQSIQDELHIICVLFTEEVGGVFTIVFEEDGSVSFDTEAYEDDILYDEISSGLLVKEIKVQRQELLESLSLYYRVFVLHESVGDALDAEEDKNMLLVVDVGNTNITFGVYRDKELVTTFRLMSKTPRTSDEYGVLITELLSKNHLAIDQIEGIAVASVVPNIMHSLIGGIKRYVNQNVLIIGAGVKTGIRITSENPKEIGPDRIVDVVAAYELYGGPVLVLDFGTATTYDLVTEDGCFSVGITAPGIRICAKALWEDTAKLPEIEIKKPDTILARETITSMQAGLVFGQIGQTEYIIRRVKQESGYDNLKVVATGGLGRIIAEETDLIQEYNNSLTLEGLRIIYEKNKRNN